MNLTRELRKSVLPFDPDNRKTYIGMATQAVTLWKERCQTWHRAIYIRGKENKPIGLALVFERDGHLWATYSLLRKGDKWNKHLAWYYAIFRVHIDTRMMQWDEEVPHTARKLLCDLVMYAQSRPVAPANVRRPRPVGFWWG